MNLTDRQTALPSSVWKRAATAAYNAHRNAKAGVACFPDYSFIVGLWRQGYTAAQAGKLTAFLARCEERGNMDPFDVFNR